MLDCTFILDANRPGHDCNSDAVNGFVKNKHRRQDWYPGDSPWRILWKLPGNLGTLPTLPLASTL
jgi:hypothetical protein